MPTEYRLWWDFFQTGNNQHQAYKKWFSENKDKLPPTVTSMISVGAGYGDLDSELINTSLKGLQFYTAVEPDPDNRETLTVNMATQCPNVKVVSEPVPGWQGPSEPVDLVLAIQVFYYFSDPVLVLKQLYSWLRPGGVLIIGHSCDDYIYATVAKEAGMGGLYYMPSLIEDVKPAGLNHYKDYMMAYTVDNGCTFNEDLVRYYYKHCMNKGEDSDVNVQKCVDIFKRKCEINDPHQIYHNGVIVLEKLP